ncbi:hypothetical protein MMPV_008394 [Pyropia vietnamensis]
MPSPPPTSPRGRLVSAAELAALPEVALVRRSTLVATWLAPYDPLLPAGHSASVVPPTLAGMCPDAFRGAVAIDSETRMAHKGKGGGGGNTPTGGGKGRDPAAPAAAIATTAAAGTPADAVFAAADAAAAADGGPPAVVERSDRTMPPPLPPTPPEQPARGKWDPGEVIADGAAGVLGLRFLSVSSMHVPVARDGPFVVGHIVTEVVLDRMSGLSGGLAFFPPLSRFAFDATTGQLVLAAARADGRAVCWSSLIVEDDAGVGEGASVVEEEEGTGGAGRATAVSSGGRDAGGHPAAAAAWGGRGNCRVYWLSSTWLRPPAYAGGHGLPALAVRTSTLLSPPVTGAVSAAATVADNVPAGPMADFVAALWRGSTFGAAAVSTEAPLGDCSGEHSSPEEKEGVHADSGWGAPDGVFSMVVTTERSSRSVLQRLCSLALSLTPVQPLRLRLPPLATSPLPPPMLPVPATLPPAGQMAAAPRRRQRRQRVNLSAVTDERVARRITRNRAAAAACNARRRAEREQQRAQEDAEEAVALAAAAAAVRVVVPVAGVGARAGATAAVGVEEQT